MSPFLRNLTTCISISLILGGFSLKSKAASNTSSDYNLSTRADGSVNVDGLLYYLNSDQTATLTYESFPSTSNYSDFEVIKVPEEINVNGSIYTVTTIGEWALNRVRAEQVLLPTSIKLIDKESMAVMSNCKKLTIPEGVVTILDNAFMSSNIEELILPNSLVYLYYGACADMNFLTKVVLGENLKTVGGEAFNFTNNIKEIICRASVPPVCETGRNVTFTHSAYTDAILYVPAGSIQLYSQDPTWGLFSHIRAISDEDNPGDNEPENPGGNEPENPGGNEPENPGGIVIGSHTYVDLGLPSGTLWATTNVGADTPYDNGNYYAWGELEPKADYSLNTYKFYNSATDKYTKYSSADNIYTLEKEDDVAYVLWGQQWRIPTQEQLIELKDNCSFKKIQFEGKNLIQVSGPNNNFIYFPLPGNYTATSIYYENSVGSYWSSNIDLSSYNFAKAFDIDFWSYSSSPDESDDYRYHGQSVRPVYVGDSNEDDKGDDNWEDKDIHLLVEPQFLPLPATYTFQLYPSIFGEDAFGDISVLNWSSSDNSIATVSSTGLVTAYGVGEATIKVKIPDTKVEFTVYVTVTEDKEAPHVNENPLEGLPKVKVDDLYYLLHEPTKTAIVTYQFFDDSDHPLEDGQHNYEYIKGKIEVPETIVYQDKNYKVRYIGTVAFSRVAGLEAISLPNSIFGIMHDGFIESGIKNVIINDSCQFIDYGCFAFNPNIKKINLGSSLRRIGGESFNLSVPSRIISKALIPPVVTTDWGDVFTGESYENTNLYVMPEAITAYQSHEIWGLFKHILPFTGVLPDDITITNAPSEPIRIEQSLQLQTLTEPAGVDFGDLLWTSSDPNIVTVSEDGTIYGMGEGQAEITVALVDYPDVYTSVTINVEAIYPTHFDIDNPLEKPLYVGQTWNYDVKLMPEDCDFETLIWTTSDPQIATVDQEGLITALAEGSVNIRVECKNLSWFGQDFWIQVVTPPSQIVIEDISEKNLVMMAGNETYLNVKIMPDNAYYQEEDIQWSSSDSDVVSVESGGTLARIYAVKKGNATINVSLKTLPEINAELEVEVFVKPESMVIENVPEGYIYIGKTVQLSATVSPDDSDFKDVVWRAEDPSILEVDNNGLVTAIGEGSTNIIASIEGFPELEFWAYFQVVTPPSLIVFQESPNGILEMSLNEYSYQNIRILPENAVFSYENIIWECSDPDVLDINGYSNSVELRPLAKGTATVTVYLKDMPEVNASLVVNISVRPQSISIENTPDTYIYPGDSFQLTANIYPENSDYSDIIWTSDNPAVASVDENGVVSALKTGNFTIAASIKDYPEIMNYISLQVMTPPSQIVFDNVQDGLLKMNVNNSRYLNVSILPYDAYYDASKLIWESSNPDVISIDARGNQAVIESLSKGHAQVKVWFSNMPEIVATLDVEVTVNLESFSIENIPDKPLHPGETVELKLVVYPEEADITAITWSSSNNSIATVSDSGLVTAISEGWVTISAVADNLYASCYIYVENPGVKPQQIVLNFKAIELYLGDNLQLLATVLPDYATDKTVTWTSSNYNVATVSESGFVTTIGVGEAVITATCGDVFAECYITVLQDAGIEGILADPDSKISIFSPEGVLIKKDCKPEDIKKLVKGIYIIVSGRHRYKISI